MPELPNINEEILPEIDLISYNSSEIVDSQEELDKNSVD